MVRYGLALGLLGSASLGIAQEPAKPNETPITLWQGFQAQMTPEEALPAAVATDGVKKARVIAEKKSDPTRRLDIDYKSGRVQIAGLPFELRPRFQSSRLMQVWLMSDDQCGQSAATVFNSLSKALSEKYQTKIQGPDQISRSDVVSANLASLRSNAKSRINTAYSGAGVVVFLNMHIWEEQSPRPPAAYTKFAYSAWKLAQSMFESRRAECNGTGDERVDIEIGYLTEAEFQALKTRQLDERQKAAAAVKDKL